jgi:hypothetical protein
VRGAGVLAALFLAFAAPAHAAPALVKVGDFSSPTYATSAPDDGNRIYVVEKSGVIRIAGEPAPFLDLTADTRSDDSERGLLSMAFAPDYATSGRFYVYLTTKPNGEIQIREYRRSAANRTSPIPRPAARSRRSRTPTPPTTTAASFSSARTARSTRAPGTAAAGTTSSTTARTRARCSASC